MSAREAALLLGNGRTNRAVEQISQRLDPPIHWHGPMGAPLMNRNRKKGAWRKELRELAAD